MKNLKSGALLLTASAGVLLALTGCSAASDKPADTTTAQAEKSPEAAPITVPEATEVFPKMVATLDKAASVTLEGDISSGSDSAKVMISGNKDGSNSKAKVTTKDGTIEVLSVDGTSYLKADEEFFTKTAGKEAAGMLTALAGDKWISVKDASQFGDFNLGSMIDSIGKDKLVNTEAPKVTAKSLEDLNGVKAFKYVGDETDLWIAAEGEPYLLKIESTGAAANGSGTMTFKDWNAVAPHTAPAQAEIVSIPGM